MTDESLFTVKLRDQVSGPARKAKRSIDSLSKSTTRADRAARKTGRGSRSRGGSSARSGSARSGSDGSGGGMLGSVVGGNLIAGAVAGVARLGLGIAAAAGSMVTFGQNSRLAMDSLAKHGDTGLELMTLSSTLAKKFGMDLMDTTHGMQKLLAAQFNPELATDIIKMSADLRAIGGSAEDAQGAIRAITQIKGTGILQGDELNQLANAGVSIDLIRQEMGKLMGGKSNLEVLKAQEAGKIDADTAITGILNAVMRKTGEKKLGEAGERFANTTIDGIMGRFQAFGQDAGMKLLEQVAAPLTRMAGSALDRFMTFLGSEEGKKSINDLADAIGRAATFGGELVQAFGGSFSETFGKISDGGSTMMGAFSDDNAGVAKSNLISMAKSIGELTALAVGFGVAFAGAAGVVGLFTNAVWSGIKASGGAIIKTLGDAYLAVVNWWDNLTSLWDNASIGIVEKTWLLGQSIVNGLCDGLYSLINLPKTALMNVGIAALDAVKGLFDINSPSRVMEDIGGNVARGFTDGIDGHAARTRSSAQGMVGATLGGVARHMRGSEFGSMQPMALDGAGRGGAISVSLHTEVHTGSGDAGEIAELSARATTREIERFFRGLTEET
jgi:tape measure domain-containing protein